MAHELEPLGPSRIVPMQSVHVWPKFHPESAEIRAQVPGRWIPPVELPVRREHRLNDQKQRWLKATKKVVSGFGVKVATKQLKVRRQQHQITLVDLLRRITSSRARATDCTVRLFHAVKCDCSVLLPLSQRPR
jgi:hypothetical protein